MKAISMLFVPALISASTTISAAQWTGAGELGMVIVEGNSQSKVTNGVLAFVYADGAPWEHSVLISGTNVSADGVKSAESYNGQWLSKYLVTERTYLFGDLRYFNDRFDSYEEIVTASVGAGYKLIMKENSHWDVSAGLGYRTTDVVDTGENQSGISYLLTSQYTHQLTPTTSIENNTRLEISSDNTFTTNIFGLKVAMSSNLALKVSYEWRNNTETTDDIEDTDTITSVNLVYSF